MTRPSRSKKSEDAKCLLRKERLHRLRADATTASILGHNGLPNSPINISPPPYPPNWNPFEPLSNLSDCHVPPKRIHKRKRTCARQNKRRSLMDWQLAALDTELSNRFDSVIQHHERSQTLRVSWLDNKTPPMPAVSSSVIDDVSSVQSPRLNLPPTASLSTFQSSPVRLQSPTAPAASALVNHKAKEPVPDIDWSSLERLFSKLSLSEKPSGFFPPISLMTAAELGLSDASPKVKLPSLSSYKVTSGKPPGSYGTFDSAPLTPLSIDCTTHSPAVPVSGAGDYGSFSMAAPISLPVEPTARHLYKKIGEIEDLPAIPSSVASIHSCQDNIQGTSTRIQLKELEMLGPCRFTDNASQCHDSDDLLGGDLRCKAIEEPTECFSFVAARLPLFDERDQETRPNTRTSLAGPTVDRTEQIAAQSPERKPLSTRCTLYSEMFNTSLWERDELSPSMHWNDDDDDDDISDYGGSRDSAWNSDFELLGVPNMTEHDAEAFDWMSLSSEEEDFASSVSTSSSAFSSMEFLPLPLSGTLWSKYGDRKATMTRHAASGSLTDDDDTMVEVRGSSWQSEADLCIPVDFWETGVRKFFADGDIKDGVYAEDRRGRSKAMVVG